MRGYLNIREVRLRNGVKRYRAENPSECKIVAGIQINGRSLFDHPYGEQVCRAEFHLRCEVHLKSGPPAIVKVAYSPGLLIHVDRLTVEPDFCAGLHSVQREIDE